MLDKNLISMLNLVMFESEMDLLVIDCDIQLIYDHESSNSLNFHRGLCVYTLIYLSLPIGGAQKLGLPKTSLNHPPQGIVYKLYPHIRPHIHYRYFGNS